MELVVVAGSPSSLPRATLASRPSRATPSSTASTRIGQGTVADGAGGATTGFAATGARGLATVLSSSSTSAVPTGPAPRSFPTGGGVRGGGGSHCLPSSPNGPVRPAVTSVEGGVVLLAPRCSPRVRVESPDDGAGVGGANGGAS